jgi:hypothetical protein
MEIRDLVDALVRGDLIAARQWAADALRTNVRWEAIPEPANLGEREAAIAAAMVELFASRTGSAPPAWTRNVGAVAEPFVLDPGLASMSRSYAHAKTAGPEALRKRNLVALPDFLDVA